MFGSDNISSFGSVMPSFTVSAALCQQPIANKVCYYFQAQSPSIMFLSFTVEEPALEEVICKKKRFMILVVLQQVNRGAREVTAELYPFVYP